MTQKSKEGKIKMNRFDIKTEIRNFIIIAVENKVIDEVDVYALAVDHGEDFYAFIDGVLEIAFSNRHVNSAHSVMVQAAEKCWMLKN